MEIQGKVGLFARLGIAVAVIGSMTPAAITVPAAAAPAPSITLNSKQLVNQLPFVDPIYVGYRGTQSFIPAAVANKKDKNGCNLRQRMIIDLAKKKPTVGKRCTMKGGVWETAFGSTVTKPSKLVIGPMMSYKEAWGQGAYAWTPEQRLAWATNTKASSGTTRAKAVTNLQVTQTVISTSESAQMRMLSRNILGFQWALEQWSLLTELHIESMCFPYSVSCAVQLAITMADRGFKAQAQYEDLVAKLTTAKCEQVIHLASNVTAWGLSVSPGSLEMMRAVNADCASTPVGVILESKLNGINPVTPTTVVPTEIGADGSAGSTGGAVRLVSDYPAASTGVYVPSDSFGIHAPVDWGAPGVGTSWVRLWDAGVSWAQMEPVQGQIDFTKLRASIASAESYGARVMYVLGDTPAWANGGRAGNYPPTSNEFALSFIRALNAEFGGRIAAYEVWNEGNLPTYWAGSQQQLAELTKGIKDTVGGNSMVFAASTGTRATNAFVTNYGEYLDSLAALGWPIDGYTVHSYPIASAGPNERVKELGQFKSLLAMRGAPVKPVWDTELNYGLAGLGEGRRAIDDATGAAYITQSYIQSLQYGIDATYWYMWTGTRGNFDLLGVQLDPSTPISNSAWNTLRGLVNGTMLLRCIDADNVHACQFMSPTQGQFTLMWTSQGSVQVDTTGLGSSVCDMLGNPCTPIANNQISVGMLPVRVS